MRRTIYLALILIVIHACGSQAESEEEITTENDTTTTVETTEEAPEIINSFLIEPHTVGIFNVGEKVPALPEELKSRKGEATLSEEGENYTHDLCIIFNNLEDVVDLQLEENSDLAFEEKVIVEMLIHSNYYETPEGISVGSTITEFVEAYPEYEIWYSYINDRYIIETSSLEKVQFILDGQDYMKTPKGDSDMEILNLADFAGDADIRSIRVF